MLNLKMIKGIAYVAAILKKVQLAKELMMLELEQGHEVLIPKELS